MFLAIDKDKAVFPIPGLEATIIRSLGCHPEVNLSSLSNPLLTPLNPSCLAISSIFFLASLTRSSALTDDFFRCPCVISYNLDSLLSYINIYSFLNLIIYYIY